MHVRDLYRFCTGLIAINIILIKKTIMNTYYSFFHFIPFKIKPQTFARQEVRMRNLNAIPYIVTDFRESVGS